MRGQNGGAEPEYRTRGGWVTGLAAAVRPGFGDFRVWPHGPGCCWWYILFMGEQMETRENQFQRRAIVGDRHFVLANPDRADAWALAGPVVTGEDENGVRSYGTANTVSTAQLRAWARARRKPFRIEEKFPVVRRGAVEGGVE